MEHFAFRELINLVKLDLSDNALSSVPTTAFESIAQLRELVSSHLSGVYTISKVGLG